jgi:hypothetical protein
MRIFATIILLFATSYGYAQTPFAAMGQVTARSIKVYSAPPSGPLNVVVGRTIDTLNHGQTIRIVSKKAYPGFSRANIWYQIQPMRGSASESWWVYGGEEGQNSPITITDIPR